MSDSKLEKVNNRLYHEPIKDGKKIKWEKELEFFFIILNKVRVNLDLSIEHPETSHLGLRKGLTKENPGAKEANPIVNEKSKEEFSEDFSWRITAIGKIDNGIGLIKEDGTFSKSGDFFNYLDVILIPLPPKFSVTEKEKTSGRLFYGDAKWEKRMDPYLVLELFVPVSSHKKFCKELVSGRLTSLTVGVYVDVFRSEEDKSLEETDMQRPYLIEEKAINNRVYLSSINAYRDIEEKRT